MDLVVNRLSEIETAAVRIMDESGVQKKELENQMNADLERYDSEVDANTTETLLHLNEQLSKEMDENLKKLQTDTQNTITMLDADYSAHHEGMADEVLKKLVEG